MSAHSRTTLASSARKAALLCVLGWSLASSAHATIINEIGDAGQTQSTAQVTRDADTLTDIFGSLQSSLDADLYLIRITDPATFSASTVNATGGFLDTQLFLLTATGAPLFLNDDDAGGLSLLSKLPSSSGFASLASGLYLLGVAMSGYDPVNVNNQLLFASGLTTSVRGAASGLSPAILGGFSDDTFFADLGPYDIQLTGAAAAIPEPSIELMLLVGGAFCACTARRRRDPAAEPTSLRSFRAWWRNTRQA
jgi:hypothetical protein